MKYMTLFLFCFLLITCEKASDRKLDNQGELIGIWVYDISGENYTTFKKADEFESSKSGVQFMEEGELIYRMSYGWCATPPMTYSNFNGFYESIDESEYKLDVDCDIEVLTYNVKVEFVDMDHLTIEYLD